MKKRILLVAGVFVSTISFAQDLTSKKGENYLPEAGDWAIGFDAAPFLDYLGNFFNDSGNQSPSADFTNSNFSIMGKMFVDANTAYRGHLRIGLGSESTTTLVDTASNTFNPSYIENNEKSSYNSIVLGAGLEKRRGNTRIQGIYGGEAMIMLGGGKTTHEYGEALSATNTGSRTTENKSGSTFGLGVRGFIGAELFVLPKTSIAVEYGWGLAFHATGEGEETIEAWGQAPNETSASLQTYTKKTGKSSDFGIDTDNNGGRLVLTFHF